jgi:hypothetical protein
MKRWIFALNWSSQNQADGTSVCGSMCAQNVKFFQEALGLGGEFIASVEWLTDSSNNMIFMKLLCSERGLVPVVL